MTPASPKTVQRGVQRCPPVQPLNRAMQRPQLHRLVDDPGRFWLSRPWILFWEPDSTRAFDLLSKESALIGEAELPQAIDWDRVHIVDDTLCSVIERESGLFEPTVFALRLRNEERGDGGN